MKWNEVTEKEFNEAARHWGNFLTRPFIKASIRRFVLKYFVDKEKLRGKLIKTLEFFKSPLEKSILKALIDEL